MLLSGCSSNLMNKIMLSWQGQHIDSVISQWGYPDEQKDFRGRTLYVWYYNKSFYMPQSSTTTGRVYGNSIHAQTSTHGGHTIHGSCTRIMEVDQQGYVVRGEWKGNNCPFWDVLEYSKWRNKTKESAENPVVFSPDTSNP
jgi:hypothetical protein